MRQDGRRGLRPLGEVVVLAVAAYVVARYVGPAATVLLGPAVLYVYLRIVRSGKRRAMEERLGGREEVRRFVRAWASSEVPPDANRSLWLAELPHLPDVTAHRRIGSSSTVWSVVLVAVSIGAVVGAATPSVWSEELRNVAFLTVPFAILFSVLALVSRVVPPPEERTERFRRALERHEP